MTAAITAIDVSVRDRSGAILLHPISLALHPGRPLVVLGETGSGKSLLAQAIMGTLPRELRALGRVVVAGRSLDAGEPQGHRALWGHEISVLPQEPWLSLDPLMRAQAQVAEAHGLVRGVPARAAQETARADLAALGLTDAGAKLPHELSGGMAQRVAFAAARAGGARIVIADEPTKGLDAARRDDVAALLLREVAEGGALMVITHDLALARRMGGDLLVIREGRLVEGGETEAVFRAPRQDYTRRLIAADPERWRPAPPRRLGGAPVLKADGLTMARGGRTLFRDLALTLRPGEVVGVAGPSGCGKSTLGDILLGLVRPDAGRVIRGAARPERFQKLFQDPPSAFPRTLALGDALADVTRRHRLDPNRIAPLMERLRLRPELLGRRPAQVSGGELQRLAILRVMLLDPVVLFADEPTSRLDPITQQEVVGLLTELARDEGCALLLVSHDPALIRATADRVLALEDANERAGALEAGGHDSRFAPA